MMWVKLTIVSVVLLIFAVNYPGARAHDGDPSHDTWYRNLKQPDAPAISCCGESDAYWCDTIRVREGATYCVITDDRDDAPLMRRHIPVGTEVFIPNYKLKWDEGNPTGHAIVFMSIAGFVWCFVQSSGT